MKKAFTLVELLIVVVVLATLMGIAFRIGSVGSGSAERNQTVERLQRLENCLSGYYAAFGTYPPVRLHGSRNFRLAVSDHGIQNIRGDDENLKWNWLNADGYSIKSGKEASEAEADDWRHVQAACKSQPVDCRFPCPEDKSGGYNEMIMEYSKQWAANPGNVDEKRKKVLQAGFDDGVTSNPQRHTVNNGKKSEEWRDVQLFKFGLMSFLLPRYLIMMESNEDFYTDYAQWKGNNSSPCDPLTGLKYENWKDVRDYSISESKSDYAHVANIASQAVCARWVPNLERVCSAIRKDVDVFGIIITDEDDNELKRGPDGVEIYAPGGYDQDATGEQYILDGITVKDGWNQEFYYYSPAPYQSYVLWSSGPNKRTFPPWVPRGTLSDDEKKCVSYWVNDDIVSMSH